jgi:mono/diheme cytochrome c family protein
MTRLARLLSLLFLFAATATSEGGETRPRIESAASPDEQKVDYVQEVRPLFMRRCARCHGAVKKEAGLRLDAGQLIRKGNDEGPVVTPGQAAKSRLLARITASDDSRMPPEGDRLSANEIDTLRRWIAQGAHSPADEYIPQDPAHHWAFQIPRRPAVPRVPHAANPIDAFLSARQRTQDCEAVGPAPRNVWLRRVFLDLTGVPPSSEELRAFLADASPLAREQLIDRLLASPEYGERWGRHWMDVWRYSDWYGFGAELRNSARHIWHWRDWIVESLNADKPYDEMIVEMLAADEIDPTNSDKLRATGFLARNYYLFNRNVWLDATVEHTAKAFLGVTLNCARCHDHVYDPIEQADYYRFRAIFEPYKVRIDTVPGQLNEKIDGISRVFDADLTTPTFLFTRGNDKTPEKEHPLSAAVPASLHGGKWEVRHVDLPFAAVYPGLRPFVQHDALAAAQAECQTAEQQSANAKRQLQIAAPAELAIRQKQCELAKLNRTAATARLESLRSRIAAQIARSKGRPPKDAHELAIAAAKSERLAAVHSAEATLATAELQAATPPPRGNRSKRRRAKQPPGQLVASAREALAKARKDSEKETDQFTAISPQYPTKSSGRRSALARWIASEENPLTARVAVNQIWMRHFGKPLVPTVFDFGLNGKPPTHPELLDWLAVEFLRSGWSTKKLHRLIVLSEAYGRDSIADSKHSPSAVIDPDNVLLWRMNGRRLESEAIRDSVLAVCGRLDRRLGGPELDSNLGETTYRRSLYYRHAPEKFMTFLQTFDAPSTNECYRRIETVVPQQALALTNSTLAIDQARRLAASTSGSLGVATKFDRAYVDSLFEQLLCRPPSETEQSACCEFLARQSQLLADRKGLSPFTVGKRSTVKGAADPHQRAREDLSHVLLNHNEFVTIR